MAYHRIDFAQYVKLEPPNKSAKVYRPSADSQDQTGKFKIQMAIQKILEAPDGQKHNILNTMAFLLGGYVGQGYLLESEAIEALQYAIQQRHCASYAAAFKTIERGVREGQAKPVPALENYEEK